MHGWLGLGGLEQRPRIKPCLLRLQLATWSAWFVWNPARIHQPAAAADACVTWVVGRSIPAGGCRNAAATPGVCIYTHAPHHHDEAAPCLLYRGMCYNEPTVTPEDKQWDGTEHGDAAGAAAMAVRGALAAAACAAAE